MSNIGLIITELSKVKIEKIELPFSKKNVVIKKPNFKLIQDIQKKLEEISPSIEGNDSSKFQEAVLIYKQHTNKICSQYTGTDINILDRNFYLFSLLNLFYEEKKYNGILSNIQSLNLSDISFEANENDLKFKIQLGVPTIQLDNKFITYLKANTELVGAFNTMDFNKFRFIKTFTINEDDSLSFDIDSVSTKDLYSLFSTLPIETASKLLLKIEEYFIKPISEAQEYNDIENNPQLFIDINKE